MVTGSETTADDPPSGAASSSRWLPGGSGGGKMTNCPASSATTFAITRPPSRSSTTAFGAACPATTTSPVGTSRTTSNAGRSTAASAGVEDAAAGFFDSGFPLAASGFGSFFALEVEIVWGDVKAGGVGRVEAEVGGGETATGPAVQAGAISGLGQTLASFRTTIGTATAAAATPMAPATYKAFIRCISAKPSPLTQTSSRGGLAPRDKRMPAPLHLVTRVQSNPHSPSDYLATLENFTVLGVWQCGVDGCNGADALLTAVRSAASPPRAALCAYRRGCSACDRRDARSA